MTTAAQIAAGNAARKRWRKEPELPESYWIEQIQKTHIDLKSRGVTKAQYDRLIEIMPEDTSAKQGYTYILFFLNRLERYHNKADQALKDVQSWLGCRGNVQQGVSSANDKTDDALQEACQMSPDAQDVLTTLDFGDTSSDDEDEQPVPACYGL